MLPSKGSFLTYFTSVLLFHIMNVFIYLFVIYEF